VGATETETLAGRYRVLRTLASGGMGTVVLAEDERLGRRVAIKRMHAEGTGADGLARFRREARIGAKLSHRNLVRIFDAIVEGPNVMIVMEYVPGRSLAELLRDGRPDRATALRILRDMAAGLDLAHDNGVLHRDVKPGNVLLAEDGQAKLGDLGIATAAESTRITTTGSIMGTAAYLAPEQLDGRPATPASDVYALAAVAYELLGGRRARTGRTPLEIVRQAGAEVPDLCELDPSLSPGVGAIVRAGMATDPDARPASAGAFVDALAGALEAAQPVTDPVAVAPEPAPAITAVTPPWPALPRPAGRRRRLLPLAGFGLVAAAVLAVLAVAGLGGTQRDAGERAAADPTPQARDDGPSRESSGSGSGSDSDSGSDSGSGSGSGSGAGSGAAPSSGGSSPDTGTAEPAPPGGAAAAAAAAGADPAGTVRAFYERAAADDFDGAWELAGDDLRAAWGGRQTAFEADLRSLESITFPRLEVTEEAGDSATVALRSRARHTAYTDTCDGTIAAARVGGDWRVGRPNISCRRGPA